MNAGKTVLRPMNGAPRILLVEPQNRGGLWHYAHALARALTRAGYGTLMATVSPYEQLEGGQVPVNVIGSESPRMSLPLLHAWERRLNHLGKLRRFRRLLRQYHPHVVHFNSPFGKLDFLYFRYLRITGARVVYTAHDPRPLNGKSTWFDGARHRAADAILVHSLNGVEDLAADGVERSRITQIPHGNYLHHCQMLHLSNRHAKRLVSLPDSARVVLFFGAIAPYKGLASLIDAIALLHAGGLETHLVIAGEPREDFSPYRRQIQSLNLMGHVVLDLRHIPFAELPKYFSACDLVAFPYRRIYQSGVLQLAYGYSRPVVVNDVGGLGEVVREDRTGAVAETPDARGLASAIRQVLIDPASAAEMGRRARHIAETKYSWAAVAHKIGEVYHSVDGGLPRGRAEPSIDVVPRSMS